MAPENPTYSYEASDRRQVRGADIPHVPDHDEDHIERGYNRTPDTQPMTILEQAYPDLASSRPVQAEIALDIRRAGNLKTVVEVVTDQTTVREAVANFVHDIETRVDTGAIDLPGFSDTEKAGAVVAVLIEEARQLAEPANAEALAAENVELTRQRDEAMRYVTPDQITLVETVAEQAAKIEQLQAQLSAAQATIAADRLKIADRDRAIVKQSFEGVRERVARIRTVGSAALSQAWTGMSYPVPR